MSRAEVPITVGERRFWRISQKDPEYVLSSAISSCWP